MRKLITGIDSLNRFVGHAAMHIYLIVALLSVYEVVQRYLFHTPTIWSYELVLALCGCAWALSGGYVLTEKRHIAITLLFDLMPPRLQRGFDALALVVSTFAVGFLVFIAYGLALKSLRWVDKTGSAFNSPLPTLLKIVLVIGAALYLLQILAALARLAWPDRTEGR
jgi:TRAP-type C4-dicarboxylate transport system permease small subunit